MKKLLQVISLCTAVLFSTGFFSCTNSVSQGNQNNNSGQEEQNNQGKHSIGYVRNENTTNTNILNNMRKAYKNSRLHDWRCCP